MATAMGEERAKESFSKGIVGLLEPIVQEMDARSSKIMDSQKILMEKVESFSDELKKLEGIEAVSHVAPYVDKLAQSRKKLSKVDMLVQNTQERVENIQRMHAQLLAFEKSQKERLEGKKSGDQAEGGGVPKGETEETTVAEKGGEGEAEKAADK